MLGQEDAIGRNALHIACELGLSKEILELLLRGTVLAPGEEGPKSLLVPAGTDPRLVGIMGADPSSADENRIHVFGVLKVS